MYKRGIFLLTLALLFSVVTLHARKGVGVGTGKIQIDEKLKPGTIYQMPPITVFNTGDEPSDYSLGVSYHQDQPEYLPPSSWFTFEPLEFKLEPGAAQMVTIKLNIPLNAVPGDYFAYLEAHPVVKKGTGDTAINIAAASKVYFTVAPANFVQSIFYRVLSLWKVNQPWSQRVTVALALVILIILAKRNLRVEVKSKKGKGKPVTRITDD